MTASAVTKRGVLVVVALLAVVALEHWGAGRKNDGYAQTLLQDVLRRHPEIKVMELAVSTGERCVTVAATDASDVGDDCNKRERATMLTKEPYVEHPSDDDPAYVIAEALHDASGRIVGVVITDIVVREPGGNREAALARARGVRRALEARIPSVARLAAGTVALDTPSD
jgi:hypothetical protein